MKFGQLIKYSLINIFLHTSIRKWERETSSRPVFFFKKKHYVRSMQMVSTLLLIYFGKPRLEHTIKTNFITFQTDDLEVCSILIFYKSLGLASLPRFGCDFLRKIFLMLYSINWPSFTVWLPLLLLEILGNMCIAIICCPVCEATNFEINHNFLIKPVFFA